MFLYYCFQNVCVNSANTVKYSSRPTSIASVKIQVPISLTGTKLEPTSPKPGPNTLTHAATAVNALQKSRPVPISANVK